jgi:hypothetical protein
MESRDELASRVSVYKMESDEKNRSAPVAPEKAAAAFQSELRRLMSAVSRLNSIPCWKRLLLFRVGQFLRDLFDDLRAEFGKNAIHNAGDRLRIRG